MSPELAGAPRNRAASYSLLQGNIPHLIRHSQSLSSRRNTHLSCPKRTSVSQRTVPLTPPSPKRRGERTQVPAQEEGLGEEGWEG